MFTDRCMKYLLIHAFCAGILHEFHLRNKLNNTDLCLMYLQAFSTSSTSQNCTATLAVSKPPKSVCSIASSSLNPTPAISTTAAVTCGQPSLSSTPVGRGPLKVGAQQTGTLVLKEVTPGANLIPVRMQGVPKVMGSAKTLQGLAISVTSGAEAPGNSALVAASSVRPHVSLLGSPGRQAQR